MTGSIVKRGEQTYRIRISLGRDGPKRIYHTETFHGNKKDAEGRLRELLEARPETPGRRRKTGSKS